MNELKLISRDDAKAQGRKRYYLGTPCVHGHVAERYVINGGCVTCAFENVYRRLDDPKCAARILQGKRDLRAKPEFVERELRQQKLYRRDRYQNDPEYRATRDAATGLREATKLKAIPLRAYRGSTDAERQATMDTHHAAIDAGSKAVREYVTDGYRQQLNEWTLDVQLCTELTGVKQSTDHVIALANGGEHHVDNFVCMPLLSNCSKGANPNWTPPPNVFDKSRTIDVDSDDSTGHIADNEGEYDDDRGEES